MCTHEKQDLFSTDLDNAIFKHESVMGLQSIFICLTVYLEINDLVRQRSDRNHADSIKVSTSNCANSHVEEVVHLSLPRKYIGLIRLKYGCKGRWNYLMR